MYFLGVRIDGSERAGAFGERNSKSMSENRFTSESYSLCIAPMQSTEVEPVPIQVGLSVHWLPFALKLVVRLPSVMLIAALQAKLKKTEKRTKRRKR